MIAKYYVACCQFAAKNVANREEFFLRVEEALRMIDQAVILNSYYPWPLKLVVFPELAMHGPGHYCRMGDTYRYQTEAEIRDLAIKIPGPVTELFGKKAREHNLFIAPGSFYEIDEKWGLHFNTMPLIGPDGKVLMKYRKVNPYLPGELALSPHDVIKEYDEEMFPVAKTEIGNLGLMICADVAFPEVARQLTFNGAEIIVQATYTPFVNEPMDSLTTLAKARAIENVAYHIVSSGGGSFKESQPYGSTGKSVIVDYRGQILAQGGREEEIVSALIDAERVRQYRRFSIKGNFLAQQRMEAYDYLKKTCWVSTPELGKKRSWSVPESAELVKKMMESFYQEYYPK